MDFGFRPTGAPPRLIRMTDLPFENVVSVLDERTNVLEVDKGLFARLFGFDQPRVLKTTARFVIVDFGNATSSIDEACDLRKIKRREECSLEQ